MPICRLFKHIKMNELAGEKHCDRLRIIPAGRGQLLKMFITF